MSRAGELIDAYCSHCKLQLAHVVLYEVNGVISRVQCRTCKAEHQFRYKKSQLKGTAAVTKANPVKASRKSFQEKTANNADIERWQSKKSQLKEDEHFRVYRMDEKFQKGEIIKHDLFGLGFVEKIISDTLVVVLFRDGTKHMAMNIKMTS